jgi:alpha-tubulin suppressor-like RCC1 family protein
VRISQPAGVTYRILVSGGSTCYALAAGGDVYAWGGNALGQIGNGTTATAQRPVRVETGARLISATADDVVTGP